MGEKGKGSKILLEKLKQRNIIVDEANIKMYLKERVCDVMVPVQLNEDGAHL
jgi:hypothetical protein